MLAAPLFDLLLDHMPVRAVLAFSMFVLVTGSLLYVVVPADIVVIMCSRFLIGIAAGMITNSHFFEFGI
jgi:predicted MFS family arabinose efflux permease